VDDTRYPTSLGTSDAEAITLLGKDLAGELMGQTSLGELAFWLVSLRRPAPGELRLFEAVLVALADHGFSPSAIAARLTYFSAPDSVQGAVAAGLLGGGSRFLGVTEDTARFLAAALATQPGPLPTDQLGWDRLATQALTRHREARRGPVPGLGHPIHKNEDPRTPVLLRIAREEGHYGPHLELFTAIGRVSAQILRRRLPLNGAGAGGAALADLGLPLDLLRGFSLLARTAGLLGHLAEERRTPIANQVYLSVDRSARYVVPDAQGTQPEPGTTGPPPPTDLS
jgi:citrate synthase